MMGLIFIALLLLPAITQAQIELSQIGLGSSVQFERGGETVQRRVVGLPASKALSQDADFVKRAISTWQFWSPPENENLVCWMQGINTYPSSKDSLALADILLKISF